MTETVALKDVRAAQVQTLQAAIKAATESSMQAATDQAVAEQTVKADGASLAFFGNRGGKFAIWRARPDGSDARLLAEGVHVERGSLLEGG